MNLIDGTLIRDPYDVIVVGAGLGGMVAASLLAKRGLSVLMIDQQDKPGGACTSFKREDHVFDAGAAMLYGFGEIGFHPFRFLMNELETPIEVVAHPTLARMTFEGQEIVFWPEINRFLDGLAALFPEEGAGLRAFYRDLYRLYENITIKNEVVVPPSEFSPRQGLRRLMSAPLAMVKMQKLLSTSTLELLRRYFHTPEVIHFFDKLCSAYAYTTAAETPAVLAATMFLDNHIGGVYFPAGGAQMLPNAIEKAFERDGGQALYRQEVAEILIEAGAATGVRLQSGLVIRARRVIANSTVWNIYGKLIRPEHIPPERLQWARSLVPTFPSMTLYMVVDRKGLPDGIFPWEIFIENRKVIDSSELTLYINSLVDTSLCPPDELIVMAIAPNFCAWPHPDDPEYRSEAYEGQKQREAERMLDQIEAHIPGFRQHIRTLIVGTPSTIERYLLKNGGAVGGPKNQIGQEMLKRLHARSEWRNLYFCGDSTVMGTGAPAAAVSGVGAANVILRELRLPDYDARRFPRQYVRMVDLPYRRPAWDPAGAIDAGSAWLAAAQCQGCQDPACMRDCPAGIDIPGFLRRMEAQNYTGAARLIREQNPFGEICGWLCAANRLCQRACARREFTGHPVRIAELQRWVYAEAGEQGWPAPGAPAGGPRLAVAGGGPAGLSCGYYLALAGCRVTVFAGEGGPGSALRKRVAARPALLAALERDLQGIRSSRFDCREDPPPPDRELRAAGYQAVYRPGAASGQAGTDPRVFAGKEFLENEGSLVESVAEGRKAALRIWQFLQA